MIRVCIICEGPTEVEFVNRCLEPYLRPSGVSAYGTILSAKLRRHSGGRVTVGRLAKKISLHYREAEIGSCDPRIFCTHSGVGTAPRKLHPC